MNEPKTVTNAALDKLPLFASDNSRREATRVFGLSRKTVLKMCRFSLPPGYTRTKPVVKPKSPSSENTVSKSDAMPYGVNVSSRFQGAAG